MAPIIGLRAGAHRLLNISPSWEAVANRLRGHPLTEVLNIAGRLSAVLHDAADAMAYDLQVELCNGLMGAQRGAAVARCLQLMMLRETRGGHRPTYVLFDVKALWALVQVAVFECTILDAQDETSLADIAEAILIINDLLAMTPQRVPQASPLTEQGLKEWAYYTSITAAQPGSDPAVHLVARAVDLFLTDHSTLKDKSCYVDIPQLFSEATGISVQEYAVAVVLFLGTMYGINAGTIANRHALVPSSWFTRSSSLTATQVDKLFSMGGLKAEEFVSLVRDTYRRGEVNIDFNLPLEQSPLVRFTSTAVCLSVPLLEQRLTMGLYHILLNARPGRANKPFRDRLQQYLGHVFSYNIDRALGRIATNEQQMLSSSKRRVRARYFQEVELQDCLKSEKNTPSCCDGVLVVGETAIFVETKARLLPLDARSGKNPDGFFQKLDDIVVRGMAQVDATIKQFMNGAFNELGLSPERIRYVLPLVISLQEITWNPPLRQWVDGRIRALELFVAPLYGRGELLPWQVVDIGELEWLEGASEREAHSVAALLRRRARNPAALGESFRNWVNSSVREPDSGGARFRLKHYAAVYARLMAEGDALFKSLVASHPGGSPTPEAAS